MQRILVLLVLMLTVGCVAPVKSLYPPAPGEPVRKVYLVTQGAFHTGIAVERADIPTNIWTTSLDYPQARYLEVGWGDDDGYRKPFTVWIVIKALFWPTRSVLQLDGFTNSVVENFNDPRSTIIEIQLSERGFERLSRHIGEAFTLDAAGRPMALGDDWYRANGKYCIFKTCNTWVASALRKAGCPVTPAYCVTRGPLLYQAKKIGRVVSRENTGQASPAK